MIHLIDPSGGGGGANEDAFGQRFFRSEFMDYVREYCVVGEADTRTPVLCLSLTSGERLDVSHIVELQPRYMVLQVFDDPEDRACEVTRRVYLRYGTIYHIDVQHAPREQRPMGFNVKIEPEITEAETPVIARNERDDAPPTE